MTASDGSMDYADAVEYLGSLESHRPVPGPEFVEALLDHLGTSLDGIEFVHVAGSNGKGSTARMTHEILRAAGFDSGLLNSPYLIDTREIARVNERYAPRVAIRRYVEAVRPFVEGVDHERICPESIYVALVLWYFAERDVDVAVVEAGIGGELDQTQAIDSSAACVTSVGRVHTDILGETVEEIGRDLAGIAPADGPLVTGARGEGRRAVVDSIDSAIVVGSDDASDVTVRYDEPGAGPSTVSISGPDWSVTTDLPLPGPHQSRNAGVAATLAREVADVASSDLAAGIRRTRWPCRTEVMQREPLVVLDAAHSPHACEALADTIAGFDYRNLHLVCAISEEDRYRGIVDALPIPDRLVASATRRDDAVAPATIREQFEARDVPEAHVADTVPEAFEDALEAAAAADLVLATGDIWTAVEARRRWTQLLVPTSDSPGELQPGHQEQSDSSAARPRPTVRTRLYSESARTVRDRFESLGGSVASSRVEGREEYPVRTSLSGTRDQFADLASVLDGAGGEVGWFAEDVRDLLLSDRPTVEPRAPLRGDGTDVVGIVDPETRDDPAAAASELLAAGADAVEVAAGERDATAAAVEAMERVDAPVWASADDADVAAAGLSAGADVLVDASGVADPQVVEVAAEAGIPFVAGPRGPPTTVEDLLDDLVEQRVHLARTGIDPGRQLLDPFGTDATTVPELAHQTGAFAALKRPLVVTLLAGTETGRVEPARTSTVARVVETAAAVRTHHPEQVAELDTVASVGVRGDDPQSS